MIVGAGGNEKYRDLSLYQTLLGQSLEAPVQFRLLLQSIVVLSHNAHISDMLILGM